jgi:hypothetical protein
MFTTPVATPVTAPDEDPTVAMEGLALLQVPPGGVAVSVTVFPTQIPIPELPVDPKYMVITVVPTVTL